MLIFYYIYNAGPHIVLVKIPGAAIGLAKNAQTSCSEFAAVEFTGQEADPVVAVCDLSDNFEVSSATFYIGAFSCYSTCFIPPAFIGAYCVYLVLNWIISGLKVNFGKIAYSEYPHFFCTFVFNLLLFCKI